MHPFCLVKSQQKNLFFGIYFRNSNAQAPVITFNKDGTSILSYITTGGSLDINFFLRGTAKQIIAAYHNVIGKPALPPLWSFGWQLLTTGLKNETELETFVDAQVNHGWPVDAIWLDYPILNKSANFELNQTSFSNISDYLQGLKREKNVKIVQLINEGLVYNDKDDKIVKFIQGSDGFLVNSTTNQTFTGQTRED
jgi:alpha-glucosidase (family GH31 glycosyl hydrolase)